MPVDQTAKLDVQQAGSFKQTVEETLGKENVVIDVIQLSPDEKDQATYFADTAEQKTMILTSQDGVEITQIRRLI